MKKRLMVLVMAVVAGFTGCVNSEPESKADRQQPAPGPKVDPQEPLAGDIAEVKERKTVSDLYNWNAWELVPLSMRKSAGPTQRALVDGLNRHAEALRKIDAGAGSKLDRKARIAQDAEAQRRFVSDMQKRIEGRGLDHWVFRFNEDKEHLEFGRVVVGLDSRSQGPRTEPLVVVPITEQMLLSSAGKVLRKLRDGETVHVVCLGEAVKKVEVPEAYLEHFSYRLPDEPARTGLRVVTVRYHFSHWGWRIHLDGELQLLTEPDLARHPRLIDAELTRLHESLREDILTHLRQWRGYPADVYKALSANEPPGYGAHWGEQISRIDPSWNWQSTLTDPHLMWNLNQPMSEEGKKAGLTSALDVIKDHGVRQIYKYAVFSRNGTRFGESLKTLKDLSRYDPFGKRYLINEKKLAEARDHLKQAAADVENFSADTPEKEVLDARARHIIWGSVVKFIDEAEKAGKVLVFEPIIYENGKRQ